MSELRQRRGDVVGQPISEHGCRLVSAAYREWQHGHRNAAFVARRGKNCGWRSWILLQPNDRGPELSCRLDSIDGSLLETPGDEGGNAFGGVAPNLADERRLVAQNRSHQRCLRRSGEWPLAGQHLVEHHPEREEIASRIWFLAPNLFGR